MKLTITIDKQAFEFELLETSGKDVHTKSVGGTLMFECHLTVALYQEFPTMNDLYHVLNTLTEKFWYGMAIHHEDSEKARLTSFQIRKPHDGESPALYICEIGYKAFMPDTPLEQYQIEV